MLKLKVTPQRESSSQKNGDVSLLHEIEAPGFRYLILHKIWNLDEKSKDFRLENYLSDIIIC